MALGVGNIVALICIVISIIFAIVTHQATTLCGGHCSPSLRSCGGAHALRGVDLSRGGGSGRAC